MKSRARGTGSIFKPKGSRFYWVAYMSGGKRRFESSESIRKDDAQKLLTRRLGKVAEGVVVTPQIGRITIGKGLEGVINDLTINGRKSVPETQRVIDLHLLNYFNPDQRMSEITTSHLSAYVKHRKDQGASSASCNNELATVRRAFRLALRAGELASMPHVPMLALNNARRGFFERHELEAILKHMPAYLHPPLWFAYITGWRFHSEVLPLTASQVDLQAGVVRLEPGTTKNKEGRSFYMTEELRKLLKGQLDSIEALKDEETICPYVFHRPGGARIRSIRGAWEDAREKAGHPNKLLHDFRRTAVRTLERSGVPRSTAKAMVGHKTDSIYQRYAIVDEQMHREAAAKLDTWNAEQKAKADAERRGQLRRFKRRKMAGA
jgi:integrase